jgi:hypothetical protein
MFSFDPTLPTARDRIRHLLGDTDAAQPLLADETIDAAVAQSGESLATATLAEGLAADYARRPSSFGTTGLSVSWANRVPTWLELAARFRAASGGSGGVSVVQATRAGEIAPAEYIVDETGAPVRWREL